MNRIRRLKGVFPFNRIFHKGLKKRQQDVFIERVLAAKTSNELAVLAGLKPIRGRAGPKAFYTFAHGKPPR